jgi:hypothetical protein
MYSASTSRLIKRDDEVGGKKLLPMSVSVCLMAGKRRDSIIEAELPMPPPLPPPIYKVGRVVKKKEEII